MAGGAAAGAAAFAGDMLIALYGTGAPPAVAYPVADAAAAARAAHGAAGPVTVRRALAPEHDLVAAWVARHFGAGWASETRTALSHQPGGVFIATEADSIAGFCCVDAIARGFVGPIGVAPGVRRQGVGAALLRAALADLKARGYAYAVAGAVGAPEFFRRVAGAVEIPGSSPGLYAGLLKAGSPLR